MFEGKHAEVTEKIIGAFFQVHRRLGYGFSENVYENALALELEKLGFEVESQRPITVYYDGQPVGDYFADIVVEALSSLN